MGVKQETMDQFVKNLTPKKIFNHFVEMEQKMSSKDTNPKDVLGIAKVPMHCISPRVLMEVSLAMMEGGRKYGTYNYRAMGVKASVYYDAAMRHMMDWFEGTDIDADSGLHHLVKAIASLIVLRDGIIMGNYEDDRPIQLPNKLELDKLNEKAKDLIKRYPEYIRPFTQVEKEPALVGTFLKCYACVEADTYSAEKCAACSAESVLAAIEQVKQKDAKND